MLAIIVAACCGSRALAQEEEDDSPYRPGLIAKITQGETVAERIDDTISLSWRDAPPDARFAPGEPIVATWSGRLQTLGADHYRLYFYGVGTVQVTLNDEIIILGKKTRPGWFTSEPIKLEYDYFSLIVRYTSPADEARIRLFWSSDSFALEPLPARQLFYEKAEEKETLGAFERGRSLSRAMRCAACHDIPGENDVLASPSLDRLAQTYRERVWWRVYVPKTRLDEHPWNGTSVGQVHPHYFEIDVEDAHAIADYLLAEPQPLEQPAGDATRGASLYNTLGCVACHEFNIQEGELFRAPWLTDVGSRRTPAFLSAWLKSPKELNAAHRMPIFDLNQTERDDLVAYLAAQKVLPEDRRELPPSKHKEPRPEEGRRLVAQFGCANCHALPEGKDQPKPLAKTAIRKELEHFHYCRGDAKPDDDGNKPDYMFKGDEEADLDAYLSVVVKTPRDIDIPLDGAALLAEKNCLACHARETSPGLAPRLVELAKDNNDLAPLLPALTPPSLVAVGDKLHDTVLLAQIKRMEQPHRDYLKVRMPRYDLSQDELEALLAYFVQYDRLPPEPPDERVNPPKNLPKHEELQKAGEKLVVAGTGLGCTSCHAINTFQPSKAPVNARGPNLANIGFRIREPFFYRWCKNPVRIIPGQEMPSVTVPIKGVLKDNVDHQLAAVWTALNTKGFTPKDAGPLRIVRRSGDSKLNERAIVGTDVFKADGKTYIKPLVIGLPNRHNLLFDLETGRLARWWLGDTMEQRTSGKSWYWTTAEASLLPPGGSDAEITFETDGKVLAPDKIGQWVSPLTALQFGESLNARAAGAVVAKRSMAFKSSAMKITLFDLSDIIVPKSDGFTRIISIQRAGAPLDGATKWDDRLHLRLRFANEQSLKEAKVSKDKRTLSLGERVTIALQKGSPGTFGDDGTLVIDRFPVSGFRWNVDVTLRYQVLAASELPMPATQLFPAVPPTTAAALNPIPGLSALRLGMPAEIMPTAFTWNDNELFICSLNGQIWRIVEEKGSHVDSRVIADGLAVPYGIHFVPEDEALDFVAKDALWRLKRGRSENWDDMRVLASGWGHTDDYHDWAVGLAADEAGYLIALPCQQDKRSDVAALNRGQIVSAHLFDFDDEDRRLTKADITIAPLSFGHRFPMGIAKNRAGDVFVTDNQGNYNPFNELNHVQKDKHFGFINALDKDKPKPPLTPPAINIPHPWTRSVNGICFLETDNKLWREFEGHLIGCEYDTRRLIRMSLQKIGDTYQGACYPFSLEKPEGENFLGPISCALSPRGELYIGSIRDSGWGGGNNVGEIVRIAPPKDASSLPPGIAEVRATNTGFEITFTQPVDAKLATDAGNYAIESFTRESTPAYGGPDKERRQDRITRLEVAKDSRSVRLELAEMRTGFVYEFHLKNLTAGGKTFFPAEAYYTLNALPD